jgi:signal recognition particle receptor subunit beta
MREYKIVFTGTMGAGKTTAIAAISETPPVVTDVANNDASLAKARTTVGLDFGQLTLDTGDRLRLFGTPGQARFDFMWRILAQNALGIIILVDNSRPDPLADLDAYLQGFSEVLAHTPCTVGVGRMDAHTQPGLDAYSDRLEQHGLVLPVLAVDVRRREDVALLIDTLLSQMESFMTGSETT